MVFLTSFSVLGTSQGTEDLAFNKTVNHFQRLYSTEILSIKMIHVLKVTCSLKLVGDTANTLFGSVFL